MFHLGELFVYYLLSLTTGRADGQRTDDDDGRTRTDELKANDDDDVTDDGTDGSAEDDDHDGAPLNK